VHEALAQYRFVTVVAHRRWGKTDCAVSNLVIAALGDTKPDPMYGYIAPYLKQAKQIAWRKLKKTITGMFGHQWKAQGITKNEQELWIQLPSGSRIQLFGADNADAMRGIYLDGVVIDEIADMKGEVWNAIIRPALADRAGWALLIGTPKGLNELYTFYQRGLNNPMWKSLMFSVTQSKLPWLPPSEIRAMQEDMTEAMFRQEMLCDFQASSDDVIFKLDLLHKSTMQQMKMDDILGTAKVMALDVAGPGADSTSLARRQGLMHWPLEKFKGLNTPEICDMLASRMLEWKPDAVIVDNGRGFAVVEEMQRRGFSNVYGVDFGGSAIAPHYADKRTEMFYRALKALKAGAKIPNDAELFADLSAHNAFLNRRGKLKVVEKQIVKQKLKRSPDKGDAFIMLHAWDVIPLQINPLQNTQSGDRLGAIVNVVHHQVIDADPYA